MESLSDIETELRTLSQSSKYCELQPTVSGKPISFYFAEIADRIKAAAPTTEKSSAVGNAAAMREALNDIVEIAKIALIVNCLGNSNDSESWRIIDKCKSALSAPPRNCDVGTAEEQIKRLTEFCEAQERDGVPYCPMCPVSSPRRRDCALAWAQMPYAQEGGANA
jgi:hypothetical protein